MISSWQWRHHVVPYIQSKLCVNLKSTKHTCNDAKMQTPIRNVPVCMHKIPTIAMTLLPTLIHCLQVLSTALLYCVNGSSFYKANYISLGAPFTFWCNDKASFLLSRIFKKDIYHGSHIAVTYVGQLDVPPYFFFAKPAKQFFLVCYLSNMDSNPACILVIAQ